nr:hypothetical protein [Tanacetum cinerariifolium]
MEELKDLPITDEGELRERSLTEVLKKKQKLQLKMRKEIVNEGGEHMYFGGSKLGTLHKERTPLTLSWERIPRLDSGVRAE